MPLNLPSVQVARLARPPSDIVFIFYHTLLTSKLQTKEGGGTAIFADMCAK